MNLNNLTIKSQQALQNASELAAANNHQSVDTAHLLKVMLNADDHVISFLFGKTGINPDNLNKTVDAVLQSFPRVSEIGRASCRERV